MWIKEDLTKIVVFNRKIPSYQKMCELKKPKDISKAFGEKIINLWKGSVWKIQVVNRK